MEARADMTTKRVTVALAIVVCVVACRHSAQVPAVRADVRAEAEAFMAAYGQELRAHDREAIIGRYHPQGVFSRGTG